MLIQCCKPSARLLSEPAWDTKFYVMISLSIGHGMHCTICEPHRATVLWMAADFFQWIFHNDQLQASQIAHIQLRLCTCVCCNKWRMYSFQSMKQSTWMSTCMANLWQPNYAKLKSADFLFNRVVWHLTKSYQIVTKVAYNIIREWLARSGAKDWRFRNRKWLRNSHIKLVSINTTAGMGRAVSNCPQVAWQLLPIKLSTDRLLPLNTNGERSIEALWVMLA